MAQPREHVGASRGRRARQPARTGDRFPPGLSEVDSPLEDGAFCFSTVRFNIIVARC